MSEQKITIRTPQQLTAGEIAIAVTEAVAREMRWATAAGAEAVYSTEVFLTADNLWTRFYDVYALQEGLSAMVFIERKAGVGTRWYGGHLTLHVQSRTFHVVTAEFAVGEREIEVTLPGYAEYLRE